MKDNIKIQIKKFFSFQHLKQKKTHLGLFFILFAIITFNSYFVEFFIAKALDISQNLQSQTSPFTQFIVNIFDKIQRFFLFLGLILYFLPLPNFLVSWLKFLISNFILLFLFLFIDRTILKELIYGRETILDDPQLRLYLLFLYLSGIFSTYFLFTFKNQNIRYFLFILASIFCVAILAYKDFGWDFSINLVEAIFHDITPAQGYDFKLIALYVIKYLLFACVFILLWELFIFYFRIQSTSYPLFLVFLTFSFSLYLNVEAKGKITGWIPTFKIPIAFVSYFLIKEPIAKQKKIFLQKTPQARIQNIIFIVDETVSGDFLHINGYSQKTTPFLTANPSLYSNFGVAISAASNTVTVNKILQSGADISDLPYPKYSRPSIFQYAKKANFQVSFLDGQYRQSSVVNSLLSPEDKIYYIDTYFSNLDTFGSRNYFSDWKMVDKVVEILQNKKSNFIYIMKSGLHFPFEGFYPENRKVFQPVLDWRNIVIDYQRTLNSYQNGILWSVDEFCKYLVSNLKNFDNTLVIYTSDHGVRVMNRFNDQNQKLEMLAFRVPLLFFPFNIDKTLQKKIQKSAEMNFNHVENFSLFPSLLYLFGYELSEIRNYYKQEDIFRKILNHRKLSILSGGGMHGTGSLKLIKVEKPKLN